MKRLIPIAASFCFAAVYGFGTNIVADPGFESAAVNYYTNTPIGDGWVVGAGEVVICANNNSNCPFDSHSGSQYAILPGVVGTEASLTQTLITSPGQNYTVSFWVENQASNLLSLQFGGSTLFSGALPNTNAYQLFTYSASATSASTMLDFSVTNVSGGIFLLDDVSVTANATGTPEPSSGRMTLIALVALAAGGVAWSRSRA